MATGGGKAKAASSWAAAMSVGTVEAALKDQAGLCRWNYAFRSAQQCASRGAAAGTGGSGGNKLPSSSSGGAAARRKARQEEEEELRTVMYLSNWGPNN